MKPLILIPLLLLSLGLVEAATLNLTYNSSVANLVRETGIMTNISVDNFTNVTCCVINFTSSTTNDYFSVNLTRSGASPDKNHSFLNMSQTGSGLNFSTRFDAADWRVTGKCFNSTHPSTNYNGSCGGVGSQGNESIVTTTIIVDNKAPNTPNGTTTSVAAGTAFQISASVAANGTNDCVLWLSVDNKVAEYTMAVTTQNGTMCRSDSSFTIHSESTVSYFAEATDGTNKSNSSNQAITWTGVSTKRSGGGMARLQPGVPQPGRGDVVVTPPPSPPPSSTSNLLLGGIAVIFVGLIFVVVMSLRRH